MNCSDRQIVIPALPSHLEVLHSSIPRIQRLYGASPFVITPDPSSMTSVRSLGVVIASDRDYSTLSKEEVRARLPDSKKWLAGWYFQQLLKYELVLKSQADCVLVMDADTILFTALPPPSERGWDFPRSGENHAPYFRTFESLTGLSRRLAHSAVINLMWFSPSELARLIECIEARSGSDWRSAILKTSAASTEAGSFSEYETYGNWCAHLEGRVVQRPWRLFRRGDLLLSSERSVESIAQLAEGRGYDALAFEYLHQSSVLRRTAARLLFGLGLCVNFRRYV